MVADEQQQLLSLHQPELSARFVGSRKDVLDAVLLAASDGEAAQLSVDELDVDYARADAQQASQRQDSTRHIQLITTISLQRPVFNPSNFFSH